MKKLIVFITLALCLCILGGCAGTPVIYHINCDCSEEGNPDATTPQDPTVPDDGLKTGLAIVSSIRESTSAEGTTEGQGKYDITIVAVLVDKNGVIKDCIIDGVASSVKFDNTGKITTDLTAAPKTKNELGTNYGMGAVSSIGAEWNKQAEALASFACEKTVSELKNGAIDESGKAPAGSDLASQATIYLGGYVSAIEKAVTNAKYLGAKNGDTLKLATDSSISGSTAAAADKNGTTQLEVTSTALTMKDGVITSCTIDSVQAKVDFDTTGTITTDDLNAAVKTKNELGKDYGMVAWGSAKYEWNEQAASFAKYVTGKTPDEVSGIAVNESTKPTDADLSTTVTIAIGGFQALIAKAAA